MTAPATASPFDAPAAIYDGLVMHARMKPFGHRFTYRVWSLLIDIDRADEATKGVAIFSHNRFNLVSFHDEDHGAGAKGGLRGHVDAVLAGAGLVPAHKVLLLCYPRVFGYTFNPISVFYCYDTMGVLRTLIYEVRNTFGEKHSYLVPVEQGDQSPAGVRQERRKLFFVSPFLDLGLTYRFRLTPPADTLTLRILEVDQGGAPVLAATFSGRRLALTSANLVQVSIATPWLGIKVMAAIHWEALKIFLKGGRLFRRGKPPAEISIGEPARFVEPATPSPPAPNDETFSKDTERPMSDAPPADTSSTNADASVLVTRATLSDPALKLPAAVKAAFTLALKLRRGTLRVQLPDGRWFRFEPGEPGPSAAMIIRDYRFARKLLFGGDIGFAEAYIAGEWDSPDVTAFLEFFCANEEILPDLLPGKRLFQALQWVRHKLRRNSKRQAKRNIHAHYDLGNAFYSSWLDPTMTYSSAIFDQGDNDLLSAQQRKYRVLTDALGLKPEHHVLEIGCGWGGFAEFAAKEIGCKVTALTISREQFQFAEQRIASAGLSDKVLIKYQDYRDEKGRYDRVASIEMFEAVGEAYWNTFFSKLSDTLHPGGVAGLQVITIQDRLFRTYRRDLDFIRRYIFPGGMLPSPTIMHALGQRFGMPITVERIFAQDYARTLAEWRDRFWHAWPNLKGLGFDERFKRLWEYYLHYCEAGFKAGTIDVRQMIFAKA